MEIELNIETEWIPARTRKLKAIWSIEAEQDLRANLENMSDDLILSLANFNRMLDQEMFPSKYRINWKEEGF